MSQVFISESSRRPMKISENEMQSKWDKAFGVKKTDWDKEPDVAQCDPPCEER